MGVALPFIQIAMVAASAYSAYAGSKATQNAYKYQAQVAANNAQIAEWQAQDALTRGAEAEAAHRLKVAQMLGSSKASMAARGLDLAFGTPVDVLTGIDLMGEIDALSIRDNTAKEVWMLRNQASGMASESMFLEARAKAENPAFSAATSMLSSAGSVASSWYK